VFVFTAGEILEDGQIDAVVKEPKTCREVFKKAVDQRLRIKELQTDLIGVQQDSRKFIVFFVNPVLLSSEN